MDAEGLDLSNVSFDHRSDIEVYDQNHYQTFADQIVASLSDIGDVISVVLCGSLIKDTLVPGWSDLDIIVFLRGASKVSQTLLEIGESLRALQCHTRIPVGIDIVLEDAFTATFRFGGRPLAMTFEVAGYGKTVYGVDFLSSIKWEDRMTDMVLADREKLIAAEIHNWRRWVIASTGQPLDSEMLARNLKTCLKLAKYESDPNIEPPYTYDGCVKRLEDIGAPDNKLQIWNLAVRTRKNWLNVVSSPADMLALNDAFFDMLSAYRELPDG